MAIALLVLRVIVGLLFIGHGSQKLFGLFGGGGIGGTAGFFEQIGLRPGKLHAIVAGVGELGGGLLLGLGLISPLATVLLIGTMTAAILSVHLRNGIWATDNGFEYNLVLGAVAFAVGYAGAGTWSLDHALSLDVSGNAWGLGALGIGLAGGILAVLSSRILPQRGVAAPATPASEDGAA